MILLLIVLVVHSSHPSSSLTTDGLSLLAFKSAISVDPNNTLSTWVESSPTPCKWTGVTCTRTRVTRLTLPNQSLQGYLPSELGLLTSLLVLSLPSNNLSGPIPSQLRTLVALTSLDLSRNSLSGPVPTELAALQNLSHLDLSSNHLNGSLPPSLGNLHSLSGVLNLSFNRFSGRIPPALGGLPVEISLDLRENNLTGEVPQTGSLLNQGPTAFAGNPGLCGLPLRSPCRIPTQGPHAIDLNPGPDPDPDLDVNFPGPSPSDPVDPGRKKAVTIPLLSGVLAVAVVVIIVLQWQFRKMRRSSGGKKGKEGKKESSEEEKCEEHRGGGGDIFVAVDEGFGLELEVLLRASAYVVGKSRCGIVYKVVVGRGAGAMAVRRLSDAEDGNVGEGAWKRRRDFESEAMAIGRAKHPNVVGLRAYYYAPDEKLLVYDYIPNGNLSSALHGNTNSPMPWAARLKIVQGAARGLAYLHECSPRKYIHGNVKSSKILLDDDFHPYISGFGIARLVSGGPKSSSHARKLSSSHLVLSTGIGGKGGNLNLGSSSVGYLAPEARTPGNYLTQKSDVYSFGIVLLEVLTGRAPGAMGPEQDGFELESFVRWAFKEERPLSEIVDLALHHEVYAKKQVLAVFHVALGCTEVDAEVRPRMRAVSESLDRIGSAT